MSVAAGSVVVLTGAGISAESGLSTFRDADGIWARHAIEEVATPEAFRRNPDRVHAFYNERRRNLLDPRIRFNAAHEALAELERGMPGRVMLVTQNVDDLHDRAGSSPVHMHGELLKARCEGCGAVARWTQDLSTATPCPECRAAGRMRPHVVWFGEMPMEMPLIEAALSRCALFVAIGTSGQVYPAAGFVRMARDRSGARTVELNLEETDLSGTFDVSRRGPASELVPAFVREVLEGRAS